MKKNKNKIIVAVLIITLFVILAVISVLKLREKETVDANSYDDYLSLNTNETNECEIDLYENINIEDEDKEDNSTFNDFNNNIKVENYVPASSQSVYESDSDVGTTNKKQEAINLVKEKWGKDDTVSFTCDSVTTNGEYIVAVSSIQSATVKNYFRVNLENKTVDIEY